MYIQLKIVHYVRMYGSGSVHRSKIGIRGIQNAFTRSAVVGCEAVWRDDRGRRARITPAHENSPEIAIYLMQSIAHMQAHA